MATLHSLCAQSSAQRAPGEALCPGAALARHSFHKGKAPQDLTLHLELANLLSLSLGLGKLEATAMPLTFVVWLMRPSALGNQFLSQPQTLGQAGGCCRKQEVQSADSSLLRAPV